MARTTRPVPKFVMLAEKYVATTFIHVVRAEVMQVSFSFPFALVHFLLMPDVFLLFMRSSTLMKSALQIASECPCQPPSGAGFSLKMSVLMPMHCGRRGCKRWA